MTPTENEIAAAHIRAILMAHYESDQILTSNEGNITSLLSEVMHFCKSEGIDFDRRLYFAHRYFKSEDNPNATD